MTRRIARSLICTLLLIVPVARAGNGDKPGASKPAVRCTCPEIRRAGIGWCELHQEGRAYTLRLQCRAVYNLLLGEPISPARLQKCPDCAKAAAHHGVCKKCRIGFSGNRMFVSLFACDLARGTRPDAAALKCHNCDQLQREGHGGYCEKCKAGTVCGLRYKGKEACEKAEHAYRLVANANVKSQVCEGCAVAMMTNGTCSHCKLRYENGKIARDEPAKEKPRKADKPARSKA